MNPSLRIKDKGEAVRTVYLIRHGEVDFGGEKRCVGHTEVSLSERGKAQIAELAAFFENRELSTVYTSPLERTRLTAEYIFRGRWPIEVCNSLIELFMGDWEGLTFSEIRQRYPELYERRGQNPEVVTPPNGETLAAAQVRAAAAIETILSNSKRRRFGGDIAVVAHGGINRLLLCKYLEIALKDWQTIPQPYGCFNILRAGENTIIVDEAGRMPKDAPDETECFRLLREKQTPQPVIDHCRAVLSMAERITPFLLRRGIHIDREFVRAGALLHDIARTHPDHARTGAFWIRAEGYPKIAKIIAEHEQLPARHGSSTARAGDSAVLRLDESAVVFLADKMILGTEEVTLEERFARSREKCRDETAKLAHDERFRQALWLRENFFPGKDV
jgi:putative nucleotidyltransferase with HDIG domain